MSRPMSEVKLLPISWAEFWMRQGHVEAAHNHHAFEMAQQWLHAHLAEREREVEALRALFEEVDELLCTHPQAASYPDGPCIEREMRECLIAARDKARAALEQEDARG